jgi:GT2 family glycosyltransferase
MSRIAVCICTYRRAAQLDRLLQALADQRWTQFGEPSVTVVVVENEAGGPAKEVCRKHVAAGKLNIRYSAEPKAGIPVARNRCLEIAGDVSDFIALIDDDELPEADWLEQLMLLQGATGADVVAGQVLGSYLIPPPAWLVNSRIHDSRPPIALEGSVLSRLVGALFHPFPVPARIASGTRVKWCDTGNVLFRTAIIRAKGLRFDESMRHLGFGADTVFFRQVTRAGYRIVWSNEAIVHHDVPPERMTATWIIRRGLQQGFCGTLIDARLRGRPPLRIKLALFGLTWAFVNVAMAPVSLLAGRRHLVWHLSEAARWLGRSVASLGMTVRYNRRTQARDYTNLSPAGSQNSAKEGMSAAGGR